MANSKRWTLKAASAIIIAPFIMLNSLSSCSYGNGKDLSITYNLEGGSTILSGFNRKSGQDINAWRVKNSNGEIVNAILSIEPFSSSSVLPEWLSLEQGIIKWSDQSTFGKYYFVIKAVINEGSNIKTIHSNVISLEINNYEISCPSIWELDYKFNINEEYYFTKDVIFPINVKKDAKLLPSNDWIFSFDDSTPERKSRAEELKKIGIDFSDLEHPNYLICSKSTSSVEKISGGDFVIKASNKDLTFTKTIKLVLNEPNKCKIINVPESVPDIYLTPDGNYYINDKIINVPGSQIRLAKEDGTLIFHNVKWFTNTYIKKNDEKIKINAVWNINWFGNITLLKKDLEIPRQVWFNDAQIEVQFYAYYDENYYSADKIMNVQTFNDNTIRLSKSIAQETEASPTKKNALTIDKPLVNDPGKNSRFFIRTIDLTVEIRRNILLAIETGQRKCLKWCISLAKFINNDWVFYDLNKCASSIKLSCNNIKDVTAWSIHQDKPILYPEGIFVYLDYMFWSDIIALEFKPVDNIEGFYPFIEFYVDDY